MSIKVAQAAGVVPPGHGPLSAAFVQFWTSPTVMAHVAGSDWKPVTHIACDAGLETVAEPQCTVRP